MKAFLVVGIALMISGQVNAQAPAQDLDCADVSALPSNPDARFDQDVMPIFQEPTLGCLNCHNSSSALNLDQGDQTHASLFCRGTRGTVPTTPGKLVVPGHPEHSWLYLRVACEDPLNADFRMPRNGETLFPDELRVIYDWIKQGAVSADTLFKSRFQFPNGC